MKSFIVVLLASQSAFCADYLTGQAARLVIGQGTFTDQLYQSPPTRNVLGAAAGVAYANNTLFIADGNKVGGIPVNNRVLIYTPVSDFPTPTTPLSPVTAPIHNTCPACIGVPVVELGQADFVSAAQALTQQGMRTPTGVASDGTVLAVADTDNNRVLIWRSIPTSNDQPADVVVGQSSFTAGSGTQSPKATTLLGPQGVWISGGKLYIADTQFNRILIYNSIPSASGAAADLVLGQTDFTSIAPLPVTKQTVPATQSNMGSPTSVTTDGTRLYVADPGHNRVLIWNHLPTMNNQPADVVVGQPDFVSQLNNNYTALCTPLVAATGTTPALYPARCGKTLSIPRFALADDVGRLYISDGGNDRVLVYNSVPTAAGANADVILGEPDEITDSGSANPDSLTTPASLAWDGSNLYVADIFNLRVVVYTPLGNQLVQTAVRNSASLEIFGTGTISFGGTVAVGAITNVVIGTVTYSYTAVKNDTLATVINALVAKINGTATGATADPKVTAVADVTNPSIILTSKLGGNAGTGTTYSVNVSTGSTITTAVSGTSIRINLASASQIAPGTLITVQGPNLADSTAAADFQTPYLPFSLAGVTLYVDGLAAPLLYVSPMQINAQMPYETVGRGGVSVYIVTQHQDGTVTSSNAIGTVIVNQNPGLFTMGGAQDPRPGLVYHYSANATGLISVDGAIKAGDVGTITIGKSTYQYIVQENDSLQAVRDAFVAEINDDPNSVAIATPSNTFSRIFLQAKTPGVAGNGTTYSVTQTTGAGLTLTALGTGTLCCANTTGGQVTAANPAIPGEILFTYATGLGITRPATDSQTGHLVMLPVNPPEISVDSIVAGGKTANVIAASLVPGMVGEFQVIFQISNALPTDPLTTLTIAQLSTVSNIVTFPVMVPTP